MKSLNAVTIDAMLDKYNDYMTLHNMFGDESYKQKADGVMMLIRNLFGKKEKVSLAAAISR